MPGLKVLANIGGAGVGFLTGQAGIATKSGLKVLIASSELGARTGVQRLGVQALKTSSELGAAVGRRSAGAKRGGEILTNMAKSLGMETPQDVAINFATGGRNLFLSTAGKTLKVPITVLLKEAGIVGSKGGLTRIGIKALAGTKKVVLKKGAGDALQNAGIVTSRGTLTTAGKKALSEVAVMSTRPIIKGAERSILKTTAKATENTLVRNIEKVLASTGSKTGSNYMKYIAAGLGGAAALTVPAAAFMLGKSAGSMETQEELNREGSAYDAGSQEVYDALATGTEIPSQEDYLQNYPYDTSMEPNYSSFPAPYNEINDSGLLDYGSMPVVLGNDSVDPNEVEDIDMSAYSDESGDIVLENLPEEYTLENLDDFSEEDQALINEVTE
jgi:hypothetical protein